MCSSELGWWEEEEYPAEREKDGKRHTAESW